MFPRFKDLYKSEQDNILAKSTQALYDIDKDYMEKQSKVKNTNIKGGMGGTKDDLLFVQNYEHEQTVSELEKAKQEALQQAKDKYLESLKKGKQGFNFGHILDFIKSAT